MDKLAPNATIAEIAAFMGAVRRDAGPKAEILSSIFENGECGFSLYPFGITKEGRIFSKAKDWNKASSDLIAKWNAQRSNHRSVALRKMALEIIQITADQGECTDRALRLTFDQSEIDGLGAEAAELANEMAGNGPFLITRTASANAA